MKSLTVFSNARFSVKTLQSSHGIKTVKYLSSIVKQKTFGFILGWLVVVCNQYLAPPPLLPLPRILVHGVDQPVDKLHGDVGPHPAILEAVVGAGRRRLNGF